MTFLQQLNWRFATKKFDPQQKITKSDLAKILAAIRFSPTSRGLQPFHVVVVADQQLKNKLKSAARDQAQVSDCSHLLVFCVRTDWQQRVRDYLQLNQKINNPAPAQSELLKSALLSTIEKRNEAELFDWARRQVYIALGFALAACAELRIDSCPLEGFAPVAIDQILGLPDYQKSTVLLAVGYRSEEPARKKIRFTFDDLFTHK